MKRGIVSFLLLIVVGAAIYFGYQKIGKPGRGGAADGGSRAARTLPPVTVTFKAGGEKMGLLRNPKLLAYLEENYHLTLKPEKEGSIEMVRQPIGGLDGLWPASEYCRQEFENRAQREGIRFGSQDIFNSPLVIASWPQVAEVLRKPNVGIVQLREATYYVMDMEKLTALMDKGAKWKEIGLPVYGRVVVKSTDPTRSNSGSMFAGLLANIMNGGDPCPLDKVDAYIPRIRTVFNLMGLREVSSADIFDHFLAQGVGSYPMIVAYENQFLEAISAPGAPASLRSEVVVLYPEPTVWSSHPFIALSPNGERLRDALRDKFVQKLAWEEHGFRTGSIEAMNDPEIFQARGIPRQIQSAMPAPEYRVMDLITRALGPPLP